MANQSPYLMYPAKIYARICQFHSDWTDILSLYHKKDKIKKKHGILKIKCQPVVDSVRNFIFRFSSNFHLGRNRWPRGKQEQGRSIERE